MTFQELGLDEKFLRALKTEGYTRPTPIQEQAIPTLLEGHDLIGCAQTGTGKTAAFSLPMLQRLMNSQPDERQRAIRALIVAPTRELAIQIDDSITAYGRHAGLRNTVIYGGVSAGKQIEQLRRGVDILTATPGRLLDLHNQRELRLDRIEILVLDEADRMLDMGFIHDIRRIMALLPTRRQTLLFSATMPPEVRAIADQYLYQPREITVELPKEKRLPIEESLYYVEKADKAPLLAHLIRTHDVQKGIVFTRTKYGADKLAKQLSRASISAGAIHGNKSQNARQRALEDFRSGRIHILVASDIAARGIDIDDITHVFNFEIPEVAETYVHRIGRTARAGAAGMAISFCDANERKYMANIQKLTRKAIPVASPDADIPPIAAPAEQRPPRNQQGGRKEQQPAPEEQPRQERRQSNGRQQQRSERTEKSNRPVANDNPRPENRPAKPGEDPRGEQPEGEVGSKSKKRRKNRKRGGANRNASTQANDAARQETAVAQTDQPRNPNGNRNRQSNGNNQNRSRNTESAGNGENRSRRGQSPGNGQNRSRNSESAGKDENRSRSNQRRKGKPRNEQNRQEDAPQRDLRGSGLDRRTAQRTPERTEAPAEKKSWFSRWLKGW